MPPHFGREPVIAGDSPLLARGRHGCRGYARCGRRTPAGERGERPPGTPGGTEGNRPPGSEKPAASGRTAVGRGSKPQGVVMTQ